MPIQPISVSSPQVAIEAKVRFLQRPDSYPESPARVDTIETHMSWVFLTDDLVYKLKKPVHYDFLDFSTLEARRLDSEDEVRLNRRLAPEVYLGTLPLTADEEGKLQMGGSGEVVDWLVKMRRLPADRMLDHAIRSRSLIEADVERIGTALAEFYLGCPAVELSPAAYREQCVKRVEDNLCELTNPAFHLPVDTVRAVTLAQLELIRSYPELFEHRAAENRIVEGHGDLRPEHICMEPRPVFIDCLEFRRDYRILDPADELAFLSMECERLGGAWVGDILFRTYREITGDWPSDKLLGFYKSYRACLRAKIAIWHLKDAAVADPGKWSALAREYLELAERHAGKL
jgi:aminoglycoside phosphotransferase family enzyme